MIKGRIYLFLRKKEKRGLRKKRTDLNGTYLAVNWLIWLQKNPWSKVIVANTTGKPSRHRPTQYHLGPKCLAGFWAASAHTVKTPLRGIPHWRGRRSPPTCKWERPAQLFAHEIACRPLGWFDFSVISAS